MVLAERAWGREQQKHQEEWVLSPFSLPPSTGTWAVPCGSRLLACLQAQCYSWGDVLSSVCTMRSEARPHQPDLCTTVTGLLPLSLAQPSHNGTLHFCVLQPPPPPTQRGEHGRALLNQHGCFSVRRARTYVSPSDPSDPNKVVPSVLQRQLTQE